MSWQDRDYASDDPHRLGRPDGDWRGLRPSFDNPATWAFTLFRLAGITVRIHLFFIIFIVVYLLRSLSSPGTDITLPEFSIVATAMAILFLIVLAHEFGHCLGSRWTGGEADEILMWPLGGLAYCRPAHHWRSHMATAVGGPLVNVIICMIAGTMLGLITGQWLGVALPNPLNPFAGLIDARSYAHQALVLVNSISFLLLLFNLLPIFPLDGGRIVQVALWPRWGWSRSMVFAVRTGYIGAILLFIFGMVISSIWIVVIAVFGGVTCYLTQKQVQWTDAALLESDNYAMSLSSGDGDEDARVGEAGGGWHERRAQRMAQREQDEAREVDRILQKIAVSGIDSLTRRERALLKRVTERKRQQGGT